MSSENQNDIKPFNEDIAKEHLKAGDSCFEKNDFEGAILNYTKIIEMEDDPISGFSELVYQALMKRGETKKLIKDLKGSKIDFLVAKLESTKSGGPNCSFDFSGIEAQGILARKNAEFYFEVLGVEPNSTNVEIKNAYIKLIKKWHPDRFPNDFKKNIEATEKSKLINEAYHFLKKIYDLEGKKTTENAQSSKTRADNFKKHDIKMMKVKSSNIHSIGYDKIENILQVQFLHGTIYEYFKVPESVFNELMNAESKGKYATKNIFFKYQYKVVG